MLLNINDLPRATSIHIPASPSSDNDLHHRPPPLNVTKPEMSAIPLTPLAIPSKPAASSSADTPPSIFGLPLKYVSLVTLAVQNASLTIIMHYSRVSTPPDQSYSAASAVLLNELLKGSISLMIALWNMESSPHDFKKGPPLYSSPSSFFTLPRRTLVRFRKLGREVFSPDCWKLSIPAILYVIQNNLQFVAASNLDVATFQVTYQMKILTTAAFSVALLRKKLSSTKWLSLLFLALGVGIVQIQAGAAKGTGKDAPVHDMHPLTGFLAVTAACFTSGLAGVYFEMVLKNSKADLWVRNVQLSLFSLLPALVPVFFSSSPSSQPISGGWFWDLFRNFGFWAWATVLIQVFGGLITAVVIKYSDNIMKGFATSLSIVISFLASVVLFNFAITPGFIIGASTVLSATWMYNKPGPKDVASANASKVGGVTSPIQADAPILGQLNEKKRSSLSLASTRSIASALGFTSSTANGTAPVHTPYINPSLSSSNLYFSTDEGRFATPPSYPSSYAPSRSSSSTRLAIVPNSNGYSSDSGHRVVEVPR